MVVRSLIDLPDLQTVNLAKDSIITSSTTINDPFLWIELFEDYWITSIEDEIINGTIYQPMIRVIKGFLMVEADYGRLMASDGDVRDRLWKLINDMIKRIIFNQYGDLKLYHQAELILGMVRNYLNDLVD